MSPPRICYLSRLPVEPVGGIATAWRHVELLTRAGFRAVAALPDDHPPERCPVPAIRESELTAADCLVFPEAWRARLQKFRDLPARKIVFVQNHFLIEQALLGAADYSGFGVSGALACSHVIARALAQRCGYREVPVVRCGVDVELFCPRAKQPLIAFMPRKRPYEARHIVGRFIWQFPQHARFKLVELEGMPRERVAEFLGAASIFLSCSHLEGLGLPPLEAMSAGCLVVGFHGDGGREYATAENGLWIDEGDHEGCIAALGRAAEIVTSQPEVLARYQAAGALTAAEFSPDAERAALLAYWQQTFPQARA